MQNYKNSIIFTSFTIFDLYYTIMATKRISSIYMLTIPSPQ